MVVGVRIFSQRDGSRESNLAFCPGVPYEQRSELLNCFIMRR